MTQSSRMSLTRRHLLSRGAAGTLVFAAGPGVHQTAYGQSAQTFAVKFSLNAPRDGTNAAFFLAADKGYFAEAGLSVSLEPSGGGVDAIRRVASIAYQAGFTDMSLLVEFNAKNPARGPVAVLNVFNRSPACIITWKSAGIAKPADLAGKTLAASLTDAAYRLFPAFCKATGVDPATVKIKTVDLRLREALMVRKEVDGAFGFDSTMFFNLKSQGVTLEDVSFMYYTDSGLDLYANGVIVSKDFMRDNFQQVSGLARACALGWRDAVRDPQRAIASLAKAEPLTNPPLELERLTWLIEHQIRSPEVNEGGLGTVRPDRLARSIDQIADAFALPITPPVSDIYTDRALPPLQDRAL